MTDVPSKDVIDTMIAEAGGNLKGLHAVAAVIANRSAKRGLTPDAVVKQSGQFEGYSNPGRASREAQKSAHVRALAEKAYNDIVSGKVPDPTNGGTEFRAASASGGLGKNVVNIGGNVFKLGNGATQVASAPTALDAINRAVPMPVPRPAAPTLSAFTDTPSGADALSTILGERYQSSAPSSDAASSYAGILPSVPLPRARPAPPSVPTTLTSRSVQTVPIDPNTGAPYGSASQYAADTEAARLRAAIQQRTPFVSEDHPRSNAVVAAPKVTLPTTARGPVPTEFQQTNPLGRIFNPPSAAPTPSIGSIKTIGQAGTVALPAGVVPKSVTRDLASIAGQQMNRSGSPDDRQQTIAPTPMPGRPASFNSSSPTADIVKSVPYVAPAVPRQNYTDTTSSVDIGPLGLTNDPFRAQPAPAVQAITKQVLNPAYTKWQASQTPALKAGQAYTSTGGIITQSQADAMRAVPASSYMTPVKVKAPTIPMPPKFITQTVNVPLPRARPNPPQRSGGLLGLLFPGSDQSAFGLIGQGVSSLLGGGAPRTAPTASNNSSSYQSSDAPIGTLARQMGSGAVMPTSVVNSSRWQTGY